MLLLCYCYCYCCSAALQARCCSTSHGAQAVQVEASFPQRYVPHHVGWSLTCQLLKITIRSNKCKRMCKRCICMTAEYPVGVEEARDNNFRLTSLSKLNFLLSAGYVTTSYSAGVGWPACFSWKCLFSNQLTVCLMLSKATLIHAHTLTEWERNSERERETVS